MRQPSTTEGKRRSDDRADPNSKAKTSIEKHHLPPKLNRAFDDLIDSDRYCVWIFLEPRQPRGRVIQVICSCRELSP